MSNLIRQVRGDSPTGANLAAKDRAVVGPKMESPWLLAGRGGERDSRPLPPQGAARADLKGGCHGK